MKRSVIGWGVVASVLLALAGCGGGGSSSPTPTPGTGTTLSDTIAAAGAVAGVVLEKHLHEVCVSHNVKLTKKHPTIADLNEALKSAQVIEISQWRFHQHLGDLRNLCDHVFQLISPVAEAAKVDLRCEHPASDLQIEVDPAKLEQVLLNLIQNAIEAVEPLGGGKVVVRARRRPRNVVIEIEDDGPGLPGPEAPIFDPFFSTKPSGTGLGLAIVHRIVTDHDGSIDVESKPGRTVFRLVLPIRSPLIQEVTRRR